MTFFAVRTAALAFFILSFDVTAEPKSSTTQVSSNGRFSVRAVETGPGHCRVEVAQEAEVSWELPRCLGTADDLYFVSSDGERVWVLLSLPEVPATSPRKRVKWVDLVGKAPVAFLVDRAGQVLQTRKLASFIDPQNRKRVQGLARHFKWIEGVAGLPGKAPRSNAHNQVELEVVGPRTHRLDF